MHAKPKAINPPEEPETTHSISGDHHHRRNSTRRKYIYISITTTILTIALLILILSLTVFKSKKPITTVNSVAIKTLNATVNLLPLKISINLTLSINISVKNPNKITFTYRNSSAALRFKGKNIGNIPIPAGKIGSGETKEMNLTLTVFADRLLTDVDVYGDVIAGELPVSTYTRIAGKVRVLKVFSIRVSSSSACDVKIDVVNRKIIDQRCHYKNKL